MIDNISFLLIVLSTIVRVEALIGDAINTQQYCKTRSLFDTQEFVAGAIDVRYSTMLLGAEALVGSAAGKMEQNRCKWSVLKYV